MCGCYPSGSLCLQGRQACLQQPLRLLVCFGWTQGRHCHGVESTLVCCFLRNHFPSFWETPSSIAIGWHWQFCKADFLDTISAGVVLIVMNQLEDELIWIFACFIDCFRADSLPTLLYGSEQQLCKLTFTPYGMSVIPSPIVSKTRGQLYGGNHRLNVLRRICPVCFIAGIFSGCTSPKEATC